MKYTIKLFCPDDPLFQPWDMVAVSKFPDRVTPLEVQMPHPCSGDVLCGFENEPQTCELICFLEAAWPEKCIGMSPVLANEEGMYSLPGYKVDEVIIEEA